MDDDDIAAGSFRSYYAGVLFLERVCSWGRQTAHAEFMDAVNDGRVRRKSDPNPPQPKYDSGDWNEHRWSTVSGPSLMDRDGNWTHHYPDHDGKPAFTKEEYSATDIQRLADEELSRQQADAAESFPPRPKTKTTIPVAELLAELRRRAEAGELAPKWSREAAALSVWAEHALPPGTPHSPSGIRGQRVLQAEYDRLGGQK